MKNLTSFTLSIGLFVLSALSALHAAPLELKRVSLSSSGIGYYEYEAKVQGNATLRLPVALDKVDDVLKSLVIYDAKGKIGSVSLPGLNPLEETFKNLPFDAATLNRPAELLRALRGAELEAVNIAEGTRSSLKPTNKSVKGRIVSVEDAKDGSGEQVVTLLATGGLTKFILERAQHVRFTDAALQGQIQQAMSALANNRAKGSRVVEIEAIGAVPRTVTVGYVSTTPIWKTAYRLTLPEETPRTLQTNAPKSQLQGWAIIENLTGEDWNKVQLTLTAGKPVTFAQDLYRSYYNPRNKLAVDLPQNIRPLTDSGTESLGADTANLMLASSAGNSRAARPAAPPAPAPAFAARAPSVAGVSLSGASNSVTVNDQSVQASYQFGLPVSVGNGRTLSVPIVQAELAAPQVLLFQPSVNSLHPMASIELSNETATALLPGALTLYQQAPNGSAFVGDAQLSSMPAKDKRYIPFALEQKVKILSNISDKERLVQKIEINNQYLHSQYLDERNVTYNIQSDLGLAREVIVEYPMAGYEFIATNGVKILGRYNENTRFSLTATPAGAVRTIKLTRLSNDFEPLGNLSIERIEDLLKERTDWNASNRDTLQKLLKLNQDVRMASAKLSTENTQLANIKGERQRLIDLIKQLPEKSASYQRQLAELDKTDLIELQKQQDLQTLEAELKNTRSAKDAFITGLARK